MTNLCRFTTLAARPGPPRGGGYEVARYTAPAAQRPARVRGLRVARRGGALRIAWKKAGPLEATIRLSDGRRLIRHTRGRALTIAGVERTTTGTVSVRGVLPSGLAGRPVTARLR